LATAFKGLGPGAASTGSYHPIPKPSAYTLIPKLIPDQLASTYVHGPTAWKPELGLEGLIDDTVPWSSDQVGDLYRLLAFVYDLHIRLNLTRRKVNLRIDTL
jgi:hypothetical protein